MNQNKCFMVPKKDPPVFCLLGRFGDTMLMFPAYKAIYERTGLKPIVIVSTDFASMFDGISYAKAHPVHWDWITGMDKARRLAEELYGGAIVPQWWNVTTENLIEQQDRGGTILQCHGIDRGIDLGRWPSFMASQWCRAGFTIEEMNTLPLVFDRRDAEREAALVKSYVGFQRNPKPMLLYNFEGFTSRFSAAPEVINVILKYRHQLNLVDLGRMRLKYLFDMVGLMDAAAGIVTIDTATLHLAGASKTTYMAFTADHWARATPKGNCVLEIPYRETMQRMHELESYLAKVAGTTTVAQPQFSEAGGGGAVLTR